MNLPVDLDYNATTPVAPEVADAIEPFLRTRFGNPSSDHLYGRQARQAVEQARAQVAALIAADADEVVFTGCATEANNLAIFGVARALRGARRHIVTSAIEHPAVIQPCRGKVGSGFDDDALEALAGVLKGLETKRMPFAERPGIEEEVVWLKPELVAEVRFAEWTPDGVLRAPVFMRLREDIPQEHIAPPQIVHVTDHKPSADVRPASGEVAHVLAQLRITDNG